MMHYPAAHITNKIYDAKDLKSPFRSRTSYATGVVFNQKDDKSNTSFSSNPNLLSHTKRTLVNAKRLDNNHIEVTKNNGGIHLQLPQSISKQYKDLYVEMDVELLSPDKTYSRCK